MSIKRLIYLALIMGLWLCSWNAKAAPVSSYQIELIIFSHINTEGLQSEYWPIAPPLTIQGKMIDLPNEQILSVKQWQLNSLHPILLKNHYPVLLHLAWRQSSSSLQQGIQIHLTGGDVYGDNIPQINGALYIHLERYFNLHFNLQFLMPWKNIQDLNVANITHNPEDDYAAFNINEKLRIKSNELNYIDHPLYGILIKVFPISS